MKFYSERGKMDDGRFSDPVLPESRCVVRKHILAFINLTRAIMPGDHTWAAVYGKS